MIHRFHIEDIIVQDDSGVTFHAVDTETASQVALRRFFPYGVDGGGLQAAEQHAYEIALARMVNVRHPALRAVVVGGCDPIDAIPFMATEWVEGDLLCDIVEQQPLAAKAAIHLTDQLLEVCELLSGVLGEEAVWLETGLHTIVVGGPDSGRGVTFWISPYKWLGEIHSAGYEAIVTLVEEVMGWSGQTVDDQAGGGLAGWIRWLAQVPPTTTLATVRASLATIGTPLAPKATAARTAPSARPTMGSPTQRGTPTQKSTSTQRGVVIVSPAPTKNNRPKKLAWLVAGLLVAAALAGGAWMKFQNPAKPKKSNEPAETLPNPPAGTEVIEWDQRSRLAGKDKQVVTTSGLVLDSTSSNSEKTLYLTFSSDPKSARVGIQVQNKSAEALKARLKSMVGKHIEATGTVRFRPAINDRPEVIVESLDRIQVTP